MLISVHGSFAQLGRDHRVGINLAGQRSFSELLDYDQRRNDYFIPLGLSYQNDLKKVTARIGINYFRLDKEAYTDRCVDCFTGKGKVRGYEIKFGVQKNYKRKIFTFSGGMDLFMIHSNYSGIYAGGFAGQGFTPDLSIYRYGTNVFGSLGLRLSKRIRLNYEAGSYFSLIKTKDHNTGSHFSSRRIDLYPMQSLGVFYEFKYKGL
ncbi:MAG: hypothetical protein H6605_04455 [Flavobacteriales bacterium]|nr:hypothetical protein [Flavobacteriales bacterium]